MAHYPTNEKEGGDLISILADSTGRGCSLALRKRTMHNLREKSNYDTTKITLPDINTKDATRSTTS